MMTKVIIILISTMTFGLVDAGTIVSPQDVTVDNNDNTHTLDVDAIDSSDLVVWLGDYELKLYENGTNLENDFFVDLSSPGEVMVVDGRDYHALSLDDNGDVTDDYFWLTVDYQGYDMEVHISTQGDVTVNEMDMTDFILIVVSAVLWYFGIKFLKRTLGM